MKTQHTPGPWIAFQPKNATGFQIKAIIDGKEQMIAGVLCQGHEGRILAETEANAKIIAAAPELLDILNAMIKMFDRELSEETAGFRIISMAKEVIKKATE